MRRSLLILAAVAATAAAPLTACAGSDRDAAAPTAVEAARVDRFDEDRAFAVLRWQVSLGERPHGSAANRRMTARLARMLPNGRVETAPGGIRNVVGRIPGTLPAIVVGAHHDPKDIPGNVGANDGASGVAVVVELARALRARPHPPRAREIRFVLFDAEESPPGSSDFLTEGLRGSRAYVAAHGDEVGQAIVVDMVGDADLSIPREASSDPGIWRRVRAAAARTGGIAAFPPATRSAILDDHTSFLEAGIPAVDLIDFTYAPWHTPEDTLDKVSPRSLDAVGETLTDLLPRMAADPR